MTKHQLEQWDKKYIWHPFTEMKSWIDGKVLVVESGSGATLTDIHGKTYIDSISSLWTNVHGHRVPQIDEAVKKQLDQVAHSTLLGLGNVPSIEFAEKLSHHLPGDLERIFYSDSGATSVEVALKLAYSHWYNRGRKEKTTFIRFEGAYHGDTIGSVSVGGIDTFHALFRPLLFDAPVAPYPFCYRCPMGKEKDACNKECFDAVEKIVRENADRTAGMIVEPLLQGASGIRPAPKGFLSFLKELCKKYDILLIDDEVATGFGRTGTLFACEQEGVVPDLLCMAKGISGGYLPLAATAASDEIFQSFLDAPAELKTFFHGHTYTGNPLACAAAKASLELFETQSVLENLKPKIARIQKGFAQIANLAPVGDLRNVGMMCGIELVADRQTKAELDPAEKFGAQVCAQMRDHGVISRPLGDVVVLMPPLCITIEQLDKIFDALEKSIRRVFEI